MNTDVIFLTSMMDILTDPIPAPFADEFPSEWGVKKRSRAKGKSTKQGLIFFFAFRFWTETAYLFHVYPCDLM